MENREKYYDLIKSNLKGRSVRDFGCTLYEFRTKGENCPKDIDCKECCLKSLEWLCEEYIPTIQEEYNEKGTLDGEELEVTYYNL